MLTGLSSFLPEMNLTFFDNLEFLIRIVLSSALGVIIGLERSWRLKEAGIRTHCIIAATSAAFMILSKYAFLDLVDITAAPGAKGADPSRIASQVVSGISFLGAGVIFRHSNLSITGLTTAAGIWATSAVGMAIGAGLYWVGIFSAAVLVVAQLVLHKHPVASDALTLQQITIHMEDDPALRREFDELLRRHRCRVEKSELSRDEDVIHLHLVVRLPAPIPYEEAMDFMTSHQGVSEISV